MSISLVLAAHLVLVAASFSGQDPKPEALLCVAAAALLAFGAAVLPRPRRARARGYGVATRLAVGAVAAADLALFVLVASDRILKLRASPAPMLGAGAVLGLVVAAYGTPWLPRWRFPIVWLTGLALGAWTILGAPTPWIDVYLIQQDACRDLLHGRDPYASVHPGIPFKPGTDAEVSRAGRSMRSFPYPPLSLLAATPGYLLGDVRWSLLAAALAASAGGVAIARRAGLPPGHVAELAAAAMLLSPSGSMILEGAFTEPFLVLAVVAYYGAAVAGGDVARGIALAAALSVKQYGIFCVLPDLARRRPSRATLAAAAVATALVNVPFLLWDPAALRLGLFDSLVQAPIRTDSLCVPGLLLAAYQVRIPTALGFLAAAGVLAGVVRWGGASPARSAAGGASACLAFFLFGRAGIANYYWFCDILLWSSVLLALADPPVARPLAPGPSP